MSLLRRHLSALAFDLDPAPLPLRETAALLLFHLAALAGVARLAHWPYLLLATVLAGGCAALWLRRAFRAEMLAPLGLLYGLALLRLAVAAGLRLAGQTGGGLVVPEPWGTWLSFGWAAALAGLWLLAIALGQLFSPARLRQALTVGLGLGAAGWAAWVYFQMAPGGVTGSDPFAYMQMGVDLARHGTFMHQFPLAQLAATYHLPVYPTLAVGYHVPAAPGGLSPSVWPPGFSIWLALAYRLLGEPGLYLTNPVLGLMALGATAAFTAEALRSHPQRWLVAALAVGWLATSVEQAGRLAVPLADVAAQGFTTGALWLALAGLPAHATVQGKATSAQRLALGLWAGLFFGLAYFTRYTQVLAAPAVLFLALVSADSRKNRARFLAAFGVAAGAVAAWSFSYHMAAFGNPLATGSGELGHFHLEAVPGVVAQLGQEMFAPGEWGWALPFIVAGAVGLWRRQRRAAGALLGAYLPLLLFHLPYAFLRLRDLLWLFPALALLAALGCVEFWSWLLHWSGRAAGRGVARAAGFFLALGLLAFRWNLTLPLTRSFFTFGSLTAEQRQTVGGLAGLTPPDAIIAASLNSGAVEFYAQRATVRPGALLQPTLAWTTDEWLAFVEAARAEHHPVYLLVDSVEMEAPLAALRSRYRPVEVTSSLYLPYYYPGGGSANQLVALYRIDK